MGSFGACLLTIIALSSDNWLYEMESWKYVITIDVSENVDQNNTVISKQFLSNSGLWRICCSEGRKQMI